MWPEVRNVVVMLTWGVMMSMRKSISWGGENRSDRRSLESFQVRRTVVLNRTIDVLSPISGQLKTVKTMKRTWLARPSHGRGAEARHQHGPATYRRQVIAQRSQRHGERIRKVHRVPERGGRG
jgi:hypothetical protein